MSNTLPPLSESQLAYLENMSRLEYEHLQATYRMECVEAKRELAHIKGELAKRLCEIKQIEQMIEMFKQQAEQQRQEKECERREKERLLALLQQAGIDPNRS